MIDWLASQVTFSNGEILFLIIVFAVQGGGIGYALGRIRGSRPW